MFETCIIELLGHYKGGDLIFISGRGLAISSAQEEKPDCCYLANII